MKTRWFGEPWPSADERAPVCDPEYESAAPLGEFCLGCDSPILDGERGVIMSASDGIEGSFDWPIGANMKRRVCVYHIDCLVRATIPGIDPGIPRVP